MLMIYSVACSRFCEVVSQHPREAFKRRRQPIRQPDTRRGPSISITIIVVTLSAIYRYLYIVHPLGSGNCVAIRVVSLLCQVKLSSVISALQCSACLQFGIRSQIASWSGRRIPKHSATCQVRVLNRGQKHTFRYPSSCSFAVGAAFFASSNCSYLHRARQLKTFISSKRAFIRES